MSASSFHFCIRECIAAWVPDRWKCSPFLESICRTLGHRRLNLPEFTVEDVFPGFEEVSIVLSSLPKGKWSTPVSDQIIVAKFASLIQPRSLLEIGNYRGYTTKLLAENTSDQCTIHAIDIDPAMGEAYRNTKYAGRIKNYVGSLHDVLDLLSDQQFDLIFLDASHKEHAVLTDSTVLLSMLSVNGIILWHDYADWGWVNTWNRVPEVLSRLSKQIPILSIPSTALAVYKNGWSHASVVSSIETRNRAVDEPHWESPLWNCGKVDGSP